MTAPAIAECAGSWRRILLIDADGRHDTGGGVRWLQGLSGYVDSRGFAGRLEQRDNVFQWHRDVDVTPPSPFPDAGAMHWDGEILVETGVHEAYVEQWLRETGPTTPVGAVFLRAPDGAHGLLVRVGETFGWAGGGAVVIGRVDGPEWNELGIVASDDAVHADGVHWSIEGSEGNVHT